MAHINNLPTEVLILIFQYYVETEGQRSLMETIAEVSSYWKSICSNSSLWTKFDGSVTFEEMMNLCKKGSLKCTKELILSHSPDLSEEEVTTLFSNVKNVEVINFTNIENISKNTLCTVANNCTKLKEIQIGCKGKKPIQLNYEIMVSFLAARGSTIVKICLSHCKFNKFPLTIRCISDCCPNLEHLELSNINCSDSRFPLEYFQVHCPKLNVLQLDQTITISCSNQSPGFPDLEIFSYLDCKGYSIFDKELKWILFNSPKLKILSLINCYVSGTLLCSLPASSLTCLFLPRSKICHTRDIIDVLKKWSHSLKEVDISHGTDYSINKGVLQLIQTPAESSLEHLNVSFTKITYHVVEEVLKKCIHLKTLKLDGCRNLGRGMKQTYASKKEFAKLQSKLNDFKLAHPEVLETIHIS